ncbi:hypothetical protein RU92_GL001522 [Lactococcus cremoris subsp. tructae]|uniref:Uncharacterized protein n=1 Tax=Lactococcus cremoris subsp. tructae TaxID=542833 RepID=A0A2A5SVS8_LACLC|nr:hypothetical protein RU92_GL001522 [Lactococcus cremoris subsp. tructae]
MKNSYKNVINDELSISSDSMKRGLLEGKDYLKKYHLIAKAKNYK